jgi:hypothetical protein
MMLPRFTTLKRLVYIESIVVGVSCETLNVSFKHTTDDYMTQCGEVSSGTIHIHEIAEKYFPLTNTDAKS